MADPNFPLAGNPYPQAPIAPQERGPSAEHDPQRQRQEQDIPGDPRFNPRTAGVYTKQRSSLQAGKGINPAVNVLPLTEAEIAEVDRLYEKLKPEAIAEARAHVMVHTPPRLAEEMTAKIDADFPPPDPPLAEDPLNQQGVLEQRQQDDARRAADANPNFDPNVDPNLPR